MAFVSDLLTTFFLWFLVELCFDFNALFVVAVFLVFIKHLQFDDFRCWPVFICGHEPYFCGLLFM